MPYTAHRKDSRHRIVTDAEISPCTYYLDKKGEIPNRSSIIPQNQKSYSFFVPTVLTYRLRQRSEISAVW